jgi:hypothetical protein
MSAHPNVLLIAVVTPDDGSRKTMREILAESGTGDDHKITIPAGAKVDYNPGMPPVPFEVHHIVFEQGYDDSWQIEAKEGDLAFFELVTYGYGEFITWDDLQAKKNAFEEWCKGICERHRCRYEIRISANYW